MVSNLHYFSNLVCSETDRNADSEQCYFEFKLLVWENNSAAIGLHSSKLSHLLFPKEMYQYSFIRTASKINPTVNKYILKLFHSICFKTSEMLPSGFAWIPK